MDATDDTRRVCLASVSIYCSVPKARVVFVDSVTESDFEKVGDGILFVHSPWSMQSVAALRAISAFVRR